jgi:spore maturation protein CgeB
LKLVIFGLTVSSSWGNGHATLWRGLCRALGRAGHRVVFFERDMPYYARHRDLTETHEFELVLYTEFRQLSARVDSELADADAAFVTSYCPDARAATEAMFASSVPIRVFYDLDTPVTLERLDRGEQVEYLPAEGLAAFELVLSYTGGSALVQLRERLGATRTLPLYGSVDPLAHRPTHGDPRYMCEFSYLGTWAADRQMQLQTLFLEPARRLPDKRFVLAGSLYPADFPWAPNIWYLRHVPPPEHPGFYCSSRLTLSITRAAMAAMGHCPSGRLFEAAACGVPIVSDWWEGLDGFFEPDRELIIARTTDEACAALRRTDHDLRRIGLAARSRALTEHTAERRAEQLIDYLNGGGSP